MVVAAADHLILDSVRFKQDILLALNATHKQDIIMTLGIHPIRPDTG
jgi:mannose-1-phosphate guanylyltransferase